MDRTLERARERALFRIDWTIVGMTLAIKAIILLVGTLAFLAFTDKHIDNLLAIWNHWDAPHYLDLAQYGYQNSGEIRLFLVFYPLFPWLARAASFVTGDVLSGAFVVSTIASVAAALLLERLVALDEPPAIARSAVWMLLIFPTSYFLHIGYTESLFIALMLGCFLAARRGYWPIVGVLGALAALARINGLLLIPALLVEAWWQYRDTKRWHWGWLWIGGVGVGFGGYLLLNYVVTGSPLTFLAIQHDHWYKTLTWPWFGIWETIRSIWWRPPAEAHMLGIQELIYITFSLICTVIVCLRMRPSYGVWMAGNWLLFTSTSFIMSVPRYVLILFPMYILLAHWAQDRRRAVLIGAWSLLFMGLFISLYVQGKWAF